MIYTFTSSTDKDFLAFLVEEEGSKTFVSLTEAKISLQPKAVGSWTLKVGIPGTNLNGFCNYTPEGDVAEFISEMENLPTWEGSSSTKWDTRIPTLVSEDEFSALVIEVEDTPVDGANGSYYRVVKCNVYGMTIGWRAIGVTVKHLKYSK